MEEREAAAAFMELDACPPPLLVPLLQACRKQTRVHG